MQDYIDAQFGGPGKGFYRIVKNPFQARKVINAGKMAVIMGIETSVPFGCTFKALPGGDVPASACTPENLDAPARRGEEDGRAPDGAGQQVRQRAVRHRRRQRRGRRRGQRRELPRDRVLLGHEALRARRPRAPTTTTSSRRRTSRPGSRTRSSARSASSSARSTCRPLPRLPAAGPLQQPRPDDARRVHHQGAREAAHDLRPRPHEREGPAVRARRRSTSSTTPASSPRTPGRRPTPTRGSTRRAASSRRTPATRPASSRSGAPTSAGPTSATTGASGTAPT